MFSPYYAFARRRGAADPETHCAINVALYGRRGNHWAMTERGRRSLTRSASALKVGPSSMRIDGDDLIVDIDEIGVPIPHRIRGQVTLRSSVQLHQTYPLDAASRHHWRPIAPLARVEAEFDRPGMRFRGHGYLDTNWGDEPIEHGFRYWTWSRGMIGDSAAILYDCERRDGSMSGLALKIDRDGGVTSFEPPPRADLKPGIWRMTRPTRSDAGVPARLLRPLEDAPFYTRSIVAASIAGEPITAVHESLSLDRFRMPIVQAMLPFRMPRWR